MNKQWNANGQEGWEPGGLAASQPAYLIPRGGVWKESTDPYKLLSNLTMCSGAPTSNKPNPYYSVTHTFNPNTLEAEADGSLN